MANIYRKIYIYSHGEDSMMANIQFWQIFSYDKLDIFSDGEYLWKDTYSTYSDGEYSVMANIQLWQIFNCGKIGVFSDGKYLWEFSDSEYFVMANMPLWQIFRDT